MPLVLCAAASQAQLVVLGPPVAAGAAQLRVPVSVAGQARTVAALAAVATTLVVLSRPAFRRTAPARLAAAGAAASLAGTGGVAMAQGLGAFLAAHLLVGAGLAAMLSAAFSGVAAFPL